MTDRQGIFGSYGNYGRGDPSLKVPVTGSISPYMNFDPSLVQNQNSQFIMLDGASATRGRGELSFGIIGTAVISGGIWGMANGLYRSEIRNAIRSNVARTKLFNIVGKQTSSAAQAWGIPALLYCMIVWGTTKVRGADDELNTLFAGAAAGSIYFSADLSAGVLKRGAVGGAGGLTLASAYCLFTARDRLKQILHLS